LVRGAERPLELAAAAAATALRDVMAEGSDDEGGDAEGETRQRRDAERE
jgi:hypothetical protein